MKWTVFPPFGPDQVFELDILEELPDGSLEGCRRNTKTGGFDLLTWRRGEWTFFRQGQHPFPDSPAGQSAKSGGHVGLRVEPVARRRRTQATPKPPPRPAPCDPFHGDGIVAWIDLLGFSQKIQDTWHSDNSALDLLLKFKHTISEASQNPPKFGLPEKNGRSWPVSVSTSSDSLVLRYGVRPDDDAIDIAIALGHVLYLSVVLGTHAIRNGFVVRGGVELGPVYFDSDETIGPALIDAYLLESKVARDARIVLGPRISACMGHEYSPHARLWLPKGLYIGSDGLLCAYPAGLEGQVSAIRQLQSSAGKKLSSKYDELIDVLSNDRSLEKLTKQEWLDISDNVKKLLDCAKQPKSERCERALKANPGDSRTNCDPPQTHTPSSTSACQFSDQTTKLNAPGALATRGAKRSRRRERGRRRPQAN